MKLASLLVASAATMLAVPAMAQDSGSTARDRSQDFNGPYVSVGGGATLQGSDRGETLVFDTDRDGSYGDQVTTSTGADAFSPGFCNGAATGTARIAPATPPIVLPTNTASKITSGGSPTDCS